MIYILPPTNPPHSQCGSGCTQTGLGLYQGACPSQVSISLNTISRTRSHAWMQPGSYCTVLPSGCYANLMDASWFPCSWALGLLEVAVLGI